MITLRNVCKTYENSNQKAVQDVSVQIQKGEFFVLVGPSGCGKSTLLRMIAGLENISSGHLLIDEIVSNDLQSKERHLSMVFQNYALYPHLTVEENILFGLKVRKIEKTEQRKRLIEAAELIGLTSYLKAKPRELSGGQRQRVALARAIVSQAPICLMDEPLSNLDAKLRAQMRMEIRDIQQRLGITMIYVTHDQIEAMTMGDRMMVLNNGEIQQVGTPLDIYNEPKNEFVATFIGSPSMNVANCQIDMTQNTAHVGSLRIPLIDSLVSQLQHTDVRIGIRPEYISIGEQGQPVIVQSVEVLGNESIVNFLVDNHMWRAKVTGQLKCKRDEIVHVQFQVDKLHFFEQSTLKSLLLYSEQGVAIT
ncbi:MULTISPECIES: ABC transporter ATP-binding protein [unclassified Bacillus (in: firmicutes)]|uniref:ABC transporter ATP-binding protein n=1 Tax=unclassified Bacillus (in: firmicutes) TaxID=185979 RepID=UPI0008E443ED|nr:MULTISPECIES: sn-glycerol-3-phosphate ABC transporter ATP-binding protein UgpC [unclassified Bacillus (in: firmicutes)]SFK06555.1 carbohydrate ABC transporter ATP-binding protein, CUT1 family [Bacillus sp. 71mf]SFS99203.1 carbohydrate ABC transporter ATP-binding protein, CUT1 family [Bacillus sp. 103mf]